ncbi:MAG: HAD-IIB family hydrolase [Planctomycetales bacterium]|nr:HAD-IIB family hydrolase [Planctomycetales bacterium]
MVRPFLLVSDVDNTLLGDERATKRFADWLHRMRPQVRLALNSGRFGESLLKSVASTPLPEPDALIGGVGTQILIGPTWKPLAGWPTATAWDADAVRSVLTEHPRTELQPEQFLSPYKISAFAFDLTAVELREIERRIAAAGVQARVVYSSARDLDVLPVGVDKGSAALRLAAHWGYERDQVLVAGDSGNDLAMFSIEARGIVVGNAHDELRELASDRVFLSSAQYADGVVEGAEHWIAKA